MKKNDLRIRNHLNFDMTLNVKCINLLSTHFKSYTFSVFSAIIWLGVAGVVVALSLANTVIIICYR